MLDWISKIEKKTTVKASPRFPSMLDFTIAVFWGRHIATPGSRDGENETQTGHYFTTDFVYLLKSQKQNIKR